MLHKKIDPDILQAYVDGSCSLEQLLVISDYLQDPCYRSSVDAFMKVHWEQAVKQITNDPAMHFGKYDEFILRIKQPVTGSVPLNKKYYQVFKLTRKLAVAASFTGLLLLAGILWWSRDLQIGKSNTWVSVHNPAGRQSVFYLPDSSQVHLAASSMIRYNRNYSCDNRTIVLEGEAYFVVRHQGKYPFKVRAGNITIIDIGTEFNIRSFDKDSSVAVTVAKGSVEVKQGDSSNTVSLGVLRRQQQLTYYTYSRKTLLENLLPQEEVGSWKSGLLAFRKQTLETVAGELERYYGLTINFTDPKHRKILITTVLQHSAAEQALEILSLTAGVKMKEERKNSMDTIKIRPDSGRIMIDN